METDLKNIQNYYKQNFLNKNFVFDTNIGKMVFRFDETNFPHLLGLHHFNDNYKGKDCWDEIESNHITSSNLKQINKNTYKNTFLPRVEVLYKALDILSNAKTIKKYKKFSEDETNFDCDLVLYDSNFNKYYVITTFIDKNSKCFFAGGSFLLFDKNDLHLLKYINPSNPEIIINNFHISDFDTNDIDYSKYDTL